MTSDKRLSFAEFKDEQAWPQLRLGVYQNSRPLVLFTFEGQKLDTLLENKLCTFKIKVMEVCQ